MSERCGPPKSNIASKLVGALIILLFNRSMVEAITAHVSVKGMVCYFCTSGLEKQAKERGIGYKYKTDLKRGEMQIKLPNNQPIPTPEEFEQLVKHAGFTFSGVKVRVVGRAIQSPQGAMLLVYPSNHRILLKATGGNAVKFRSLSGRFVRLKLRSGTPTSSKWIVDTIEKVAPAR